MKIDSDALKTFASKIIVRRNAAVKHDINSKKNFIRANAKAIAIQLDAVKAVAPAVYALYKSKINGIDELFTDGWYHRLGFSDRHKNAIGCCGGGCSGNSLFVDFETGEFIVSNWHNENGKPTLTTDELAENYWNDYDVRAKIETIATGLTEFVERAAQMITAMAR